MNIERVFSLHQLSEQDWRLRTAYCGGCRTQVPISKTAEYGNQCKNAYADVKQYNKSHAFPQYELTADDKKRIIGRRRRCSICKRKLSAHRPAVFDHDHNTGQIRGVLCRDCNLALGLLLDSIPALRSAIKYLEDARRSA